MWSYEYLPVTCDHFSCWCTPFLTLSVFLEEFTCTFFLTLLTHICLCRHHDDMKLKAEVLSRSISFAGNWPFFIGVAVWGKAGLNNLLFFLLPFSLLYTTLPLFPPFLHNRYFKSFSRDWGVVLHWTFLSMEITEVKDRRKPASMQGGRVDTAIITTLGSRVP